jgi:hypothetical protein
MMGKDYPRFENHPPLSLGTTDSRGVECREFTARRVRIVSKSGIANPES